MFYRQYLCSFHVRECSWPLTYSLTCSLCLTTPPSSTHTRHLGKCDAQLSLLRRVFHDAGGVDKAADLVEHYCDVGYDHLIPAYAKYNWSWIQYYNVDVKATIVLVLALTGYLVIKLCRCCCRCCCRRVTADKSKAKVD